MRTPYLALIATALFIQACDKRDQTTDAQRMEDTENTSYSQPSTESVVNEPIAEPIAATPAPSAAVDQGDTLAEGAFVDEDAGKDEASSDVAAAGAIVDEDAGKDEASSDVAAAAVVEEDKSSDDLAAAPIVTNDDAFADEDTVSEEPYEVVESGYLKDGDIQAMEEDEWATQEQEQQAMEEDRLRQYESKTYNELQLSDDADDYPIIKDTGSMTYNEWQSDESYTK